MRNLAEAMGDLKKKRGAAKTTPLLYANGRRNDRIWGTGRSVCLFSSDAHSELLVFFPLPLDGVVVFASPAAVVLSGFVVSVLAAASVLELSVLEVSFFSSALAPLLYDSLR